MSQAVDQVVVRQATLYQRIGKPIVDELLAAVIAVLAAPIMAVAAAAVRVTMGSPVILRQRRVGLHGQEFTVFKFRTMLPDRRVSDVSYSGPDRRKVHKTPDDPRITPVGRFLRRTSIDELPQLFNVLRSEMSLVGPRPELPMIVAGYASWQHERHAVKPGLTGLWQLEARDADELMHERTDIDVRYVATLSLATDVRLLLRTIPNVLGRGFSKRKTT